MSTKPSVFAPIVNPLSDIDFDVADPNGWFKYVADSLVLTGLSRRTGETYAREIRILVHRFKKPPFMLTEGQVRTFILERHDKLKGSSQRILYRGLRFLYHELFKYDWELLKAVRGSYETVEPTILSREEVGRLFRCIKTPHIYAYLRTVYSCGLRLSEALNIEPGDIDRAGGILHIRQGKGAKDRKVVLPALTVEILGRYWLRHRNPKLIFPALGRTGKGGPTAAKPMSVTAVQGGLRRHLKQAGITKDRVSIHTLRHSYATHLLDAGVPLTFLQRQLGHKDLKITLTYIHLSKSVEIDSAGIVNDLMGAIR